MRKRNEKGYAFPKTGLLIMLFLIFMSSFRIAAQLPDIRIDLNIQKKPVLEILDEITARTGYFFTYDASIIRENSTTSLQVKDLPLSQCLDSLFRDSLLNYELVDRNIVISRTGPSANQPPAEKKKFHYLKGIIEDEKSGDPLPFATITITGTSKGTISNLEGKFTLKIPVDSDTTSVTTSYIGYQNRNLDVVPPVETDLVIAMEKDIISLQEVVIRYKDPLTLLGECLRAIPDNYIDDHSAMTAYYRENVQKNKKFMLFSEAVLEIAKEPYTFPEGVERVKIIRGRKTININPEDSILMKIKSGVRSSIELDIVKNLPDFLSEENRNLYDYELNDILSYGNKLVYLISFGQKESIQEALYTGELYIDIESLALLAADFRINPKYISRQKDMFIVSKSRKIKTRPLSANYHVEYRQSDGRYHLNQVRGEVKFKMRKKKQWLSSTYAITIEMIITDVEPGVKKKIRFNEQLNPNVILSEETFAYDPSFWGNYNTIRPEASLREVLEQMNSKTFSDENIPPVR